MRDGMFDEGITEAGARLSGLPACPTLEWLERLTASAEIAYALPILEHLFGVLPLLDLLEGGAESADVRRAIARGEVRACLGLFTPTPEFSWTASAVRGQLHSAHATLTGEVRIQSGPAHPAALDTWVLALARFPGSELRLALFSTKTMTPLSSWLVLDEVHVGNAFLSSPVGVRKGEPAWRALDAYAGVYAFVAALYARRGLRAIRRALRKTVRGGAAFNTSQVLAMGTTELEVQVTLLTTASRAHLESDAGAAGNGLALAASAARLLSQVAVRTVELRAKAGVTGPGPLSSSSTQDVIDIALGGQLLIESELACAIGI
jgi:hypothetical protein